MRNLITLMTLVLLPNLAHANALASIYNGQQIQMDGTLLVQDADHPDDFYVLPQKFRLKQGSKYNPETGNYEHYSGVTLTTAIKGAQKYSTFSMRFQLDAPTDLEMLEAGSRLSAISPNGNLKGIAPICGLALAVPGWEAPSAPVPVDPNATVIQYSISSSEADKCDSFVTLNEFSLTYTVPYDQEDSVKVQLMSDTGLTLPSIDLVLPYKYKDKVSVWVNTRSAIEQVKAAVGLQGTLEAVTGSINASMEHLQNTLEISGGLNVDCQNTDDVCQQFIKQAMDILAKQLFVLQPELAKGDTTPLVVGDKDKQVSAGMFKVGLAFDEASVDKDARLTVDFSKVNYSSVHTQAQVVAKVHGSL